MRAAMNPSVAPSVSQSVGSLVGKSKPLVCLFIKMIEDCFFKSIKYLEGVFNGLRGNFSSTGLRDEMFNGNDRFSGSKKSQKWLESVL